MAGDARRTVLVAAGICVASSFILATAKGSLTAIHAENRRLDTVRNILVAGELFEEDVDIAAIYAESIEPVMIELATGETLPEERFDDVLNVSEFDIEAVARHPEHGRVLDSTVDVAQITRAPKYMVVYLVRAGDGFEKIILPVHGRGLFSMLYGFLALEADLSTVSGITFYDQGETPGLGGEITNPRWQQIWKGKEAFGETGELRLTVVKGTVDPASPDAVHQIDGLSGATMTTRSVDNLVKFWLGAEGYGPLLERLRQAGVGGQSPGSSGVAR